MSDDKKITSLAEHKAKLQKKDHEDSKETVSVVNAHLPPEVIEELNKCIKHEDMEATLRVFQVLRSISDKVTIEFDHHDIWITTHHEEEDGIDAGVDFEEQVIKRTSSSQSATVNFAYDEEDWDSIDDFMYSVGFSFRRCIESLMYWGKGEKK